MADGDLISRASLLAAIAELKESPWHNFGKVDGPSPEGVEAIWYYGYLQRKEAVEIIEDMCIKKEPAKRGRWIIDYAEGTKIYHAHCSECNKEPDRNIGGDYYIDKLSDYCPNCGAKMDGDSNDQP